MSKDYKWKRFWCPREGSYSLADQGFLADPEAEYGQEFNPDLTTFDRLQGVPCLAMLGEPGIGKSWTLSREALSDEAMARGAKLLRFDLRQFGSEGRLFNALFESEELRDWKDGSYDLHLYLDSLDECLLRIDNVATLLADELPKLSVTRLKLRIACRTAPWPSILEHELSDLYGKEGFRAFELAPLRRVDVVQAAVIAGVPDAEQLLQRIHDLGIVPFAIKPITLNFLLDTYLRNGDIPSNAEALYEQGCLILCEERNESRLAAGRRGALSPIDRVAFASRIAAATQLGNRFAVWTGTNAAVPPEDVLVDDLAGGTEFGQQQLGVTSPALRETLDTGLFSSRGPERLGWAHQTYAEFLAARYCNVHKMPVQQLRSILFHPRWNRVIPQLREVAAWIALNNSELFSDIAEHDPEVLLGTSASSLSNSQRAAITAALLKSCEKGQFLHFERAMDSQLRHLAHLGLSGQIGQVIRDKSRSESARHLAIDIARRCRTANLDNDLASIALDKTEPAQLRNSAAFTVSELGGVEARLKLRPLADGTVEDDSRQECKGAALRALWPALMDAEELFRCLTPRRDPSLYGLYDDFLDRSILPNLMPRDVPVALLWYSKQQHQQIGSFEDLLQGILSLAWEYVEEDGVRKLLAEILAQRISSQMPISQGNARSRIESTVSTDTVRRRCLLTSLLPLLGCCQSSALFYPLHLLVPEDIDWLISRVLNQESPSSLKLEAEAIRRLAYCWEPKAVESVWYACQKSMLLAEACNGLFQPMSLDSEEVKWVRKEAALKDPSQQPLLTPSPHERIETQLELSESGDVDAWLQLMMDMTLEPTSTPSRYLKKVAVPSSPGWSSADDQTKQRIECAAIRFLEQTSFRKFGWPENGGIPSGAIAGVTAIAFLHTVRPESLNGRPASFWVPWCSSIVRYWSGASDLLPGEAALLPAAFSAAPDEVNRLLLKQVDMGNEAHGYFFCEDRLDILWNTELAAALGAKVRGDTLKPEALRGLLTFLLKKKAAMVREWAEEAIGEAHSDVDRRTAIGSALLMGAEDAGWSAVWPLVEHDVAFGRALMERASYADPTHVSFTKGLTDEQLATLYRWLLTQYPITDSNQLGSGIVGPHDTIRFLREGVLERLKKRASFVACEELTTTLIRFPQYPWLRFHIDEAETLACAVTWRALPINQILSIAADRNKRLIESSAQLVSVVLESLERLQSGLHDELPAVRDLWNSKPEPCPKDEEDVSDYVARHFRRDLAQGGVIINREVQIRRGKLGDMSGQKTDMHIDAIASVEGTDEIYGPISLIVEVKGSWNSGLMEDMQRQLKNRYLQNNQCETGLYLVVFFSAASWFQADPRKTKNTQLSIGELRRKLEEQAASLSDAINLKSYVLDASLDSTAAQL